MVFYEGSVKCWGMNNHGQLGFGFSSDVHVPTPVQLGPGFLLLAMHEPQYRGCYKSLLVCRQGSTRLQQLPDTHTPAFCWCQDQSCAGVSTAMDSLG